MDFALPFIYLNLYICRNTDERFFICCSFQSQSLKGNTNKNDNTSFIIFTYFGARLCGGALPAGAQIIKSKGKKGVDPKGKPKKETVNSRRSDCKDK